MASQKQTRWPYSPKYIQDLHFTHTSIHTHIRTYNTYNTYMHTNNHSLNYLKIKIIILIKFAYHKTRLYFILFDSGFYLLSSQRCKKGVYYFHSLLHEIYSKLLSAKLDTYYKFAL